MPAATPSTDATGSAVSRRSRPIVSAIQTNGPPGSAPGARIGCSDDPGTAATTASTRNPATAAATAGQAVRGRDACISSPTLAPARR